MQHATLVAALRHAAEGDHGILFVEPQGDRLVSYAELFEESQRVGEGLRELGVGRDDRVALVFPTGPEFFHAFFGVLLAGGAPVPVYPPIRLGRLHEYNASTARQVRSAGARLVLASGSARRLIGEAVAQSQPELGCLELEQLPSGRAPATEPKPEALAFIQFSSGSTQAPKPIRLTHAQILANIEALYRAYRGAYPVEHRFVSWLPLYHDMGLIGQALLCIACDLDLALIPPQLFAARPALWLQTISRTRCTVSVSPNFGYSLCLDRVRDEDLQGVDLSCWRIAVSGAEPVSPVVLEEFAERFGAWGLSAEAQTPAYGLAEATLAVTLSNPLRGARIEAFDRARLLTEGRAVPAPGGERLSSVGSPLAGFSVRIADEEGRDLEERCVGRVWVAGPSIMEGYHEQPEATGRTLRDGWLDTGDTGFLMEGELFLYGRAKDLIVIRGANHAPQTFEQAVDGMPGIRRGCVAAVGHAPDTGRGESLLVFVERGREADPRRDPELAGSVRRRVLSVTGVRAEEVFVLAPGTLPRTSSGKLRRAETLRRHLVGELHPPDPVSPLRIGLARLRSWWALLRSPAGIRSSS